MRSKSKSKQIAGLLAGMLVLGGVEAAPAGVGYKEQHEEQRRERYEEPGRRPDLHPSNGFRYDERQVHDRRDDRYYVDDRKHRKPKHRRPPDDFRDVRIHIHDHRHYFGRGPDVRTRVIIVKGQPLPRGWGRPMTREQLRYLPYYHGYEWRRVGTDMILVELATNIVHEVLVDVLLDD